MQGKAAAAGSPVTFHRRLRGGGNGALLAIPLMGEPLIPAQWIGGLVVLTGIYLVNRQ